MPLKLAFQDSFLLIERRTEREVTMMFVEPNVTRIRNPSLAYGLINTAVA